MNAKSWLLFQDNSYRAADGEPPLTYEDMEKIMKDILIGMDVCLGLFFMNIHNLIFR